jgi:hypothetical protein
VLLCELLYQGTTSQAAEKVVFATGSYQGTTSVVPKRGKLG